MAKDIRTLLHSCYVPNTGRGEDAVIVSEIVEDEHGATKPNLKVFRSPTVSFWLTKEACRNHADKKEIEHKNSLDEYQVKYAELDKEIFNRLHGYTPKFIPRNQRRELLQSPFLYGGNIDIRARIAIAYKKKLLSQERTPHVPTTGFFDIEKSLIKGSYGKLPIMVFTAENKVFVALKRSFMWEPRNGIQTEVTLEEIERTAHEVLGPLVESVFSENEGLHDVRHKLPFTYSFFVGDTEVDMIRWIFARMHESKISFIGIWNLGFDIPEIIKILQEENIPLEDVFSDPQFLDTGYAFAKFREDKRDVQHFTQKWHWMSATAHFQFIDSMALYSYIRVVDGKEASYKLDYILNKFGLGGKLKLGQTEELEGLQEADWHRAMLSRHFINYTIYAMWDAMGLQLLEWINNDIAAMVTLGDVTPPENFVNQTIRVTNTLFEEQMQLGYVLGTGVDVEGIHDEDLLTAGGAVLEPQNIVPGGMKLFKEWPNHITNCYAWQNDVDFSAQYPTNAFTMNISKQTKLGTLIKVIAPWVQTRYKPQEAVEVVCSYLISPKASGVDLGVEFFDLPGYDEMNNLFEQKMKMAA